MKTFIIGLGSVLFFGFFMIAATEKDHRAFYPGTDPVVVELKNLDPNQLRVTTVGMGRTTGHILNMEVKNLTDRDMEIHYTPVFIPSDGKHQSYIVPESGIIRVPGGSTVVHPIDGYCADNGKPPLGTNSRAPSIDDWQSPNPDYFNDEGLDPSMISVSDDPVFDNGNPVFDPVVKQPSDLIRILRELIGSPPPPPRPMPVAPDEYNYASLREADPTDHVINIPINVLPPSMQDAIFELTDTGDPLPLDVSVLGGRDFPIIDLDFNAEPENTANLLYDAIIKITNVVHEMVETGLYDFPFPPEEVIQQTFWIYTGSFRETPYEFEDFRERVTLQFETVRGIHIEEAPEEEGRQFEEGVENFWSGFQIIGEEAKVFKGTHGVKTKDSDEERRSLPIQPVEKDPIEAADQPVTDVPKSGPEDEERDSCDNDFIFNISDPDYEFKIEEGWGNEEERNNIRDRVDDNFQSEENPEWDDEELEEEYGVGHHPTSSLSFWRGGSIGGFASAHAKTYFIMDNGRWNWVWGTDKLDTDADGTLDITMTFFPGENCRAVVTGTAYIKVMASSNAFDAVAGTTESDLESDQLDFVRGAHFLGQKATEWLVLRGRGKTNKSFNQYVMDDVKEQVEGEITEAIENELTSLAEQQLNAILEELGIDLKIPEIEMPNFEMPDLKDLIEEWLDIEIPDIEQWISDGIEAIWNLPLVANTYATANGYYVVSVGANSGSARVSSNVHYSRASTEGSDQAIRWSGNDEDSDLVTDTQPNSLTIDLTGHSSMVAEAASRFGFGNGNANAKLESELVLSMAGVCICEDGSFVYDFFSFSAGYRHDEDDYKDFSSHWRPLESEFSQELESWLNNLKRDGRNNLQDGDLESKLREKMESYLNNAEE